jgi:hypothetical protein
LLDWVRRHEHDFAGGDGWGTLENDILQSVLAAGRPADVWTAARLFAQVRQGALPRLQIAAFASRQGRALLVAVGLDVGALEGERLRALALLARDETLWPPQPSLGGIEPVGVGEQEYLIDRLTPLLADRAEPLRAAAARVLLAVSRPPSQAGGRCTVTSRALPALATAYGKEPPGPARDALAEAVCVLGGPAHWQKVSGNPGGLLVRLRDLGQQPPQAWFWLEMHSAGLAVYEPPVLRLERLEGKGKVAQVKEQPLPVAHLPRPWSDGWDGSGLLMVEVPTAGLATGTWRITVRGTAGKGADKVHWTSEPASLILSSPQPPGLVPQGSPRLW